MSNEEYTAKVEERLNQYYQACLKYAGKDGRVNVRQVVISIWGMKDGKFRDGSWDKTYKALDELVKRQKLRKRERQYYIVPNETPPNNNNPEPSIEDKEIIQQNTPKTDTETNNNVIEEAVTLSEGGSKQDNNILHQPLVQRFIDVLQGGVIDNLPPNNNQDKTEKPMNTGQKRSMLREVKQVMDATFTGGGDLAHKTRALIMQVYHHLVNRRVEDAKTVLLQAHDVVNKEKNRATDEDHEKAVYALDIGFFLYAFAVANEKLRRIAWDIWDARDEFRSCLYDAIMTASKVISLAERDEVDINEVVIDEEIAKLKEILCKYNAQEE